MSKSHASRKTKHPEIFARRPWERIEVAGLGEAALVPTMLNMEEQSYYVWLAREWASGQGSIVDLGAFAGGSTACLAEGVAQAGRDQIVHGYDKFEMLDFNAFRARYDRYLSSAPANVSPFRPRALPPFSGMDLLPLAAFFLEPWGNGVELHKGQIEDMSWAGGPIDLLVLDASKTADTMDRMSTTFFPHLIPGRSVVVQQDLLWWQQPWIAAQMALLSDFLIPIAHVPRYSVSFLCTRAISQQVISELKLAQMQDAQLVQALREAKQMLKDFKIDRGLRKLIAAVKANPGTRKAFQMKKPN